MNHEYKHFGMAIRTIFLDGRKIPCTIKYMTQTSLQSKMNSMMPMASDNLGQDPCIKDH